MRERLAMRIRAEVAQIDRLLATYAPLLSRAHEGGLDAVETAAAAAVAHSFYHGVETLFLAVAKDLNETLPQGPRWHRDLLEQMSRSTPRRPALISGDTSQSLMQYLAFRHVFRHAYSFLLRSEDVSELAASMQEVWLRLRSELCDFAGMLTAIADCPEDPPSRESHAQ